MKQLKIFGLLVVILLTTTQCAAQRTYTVKAENNDISNNLDLKAVATVFGESKNLEEFENKLNDYDRGISNLDLNKDGQVDYLRVVEDMRNNTHVVVIQAVLEKDIYQDVATIVVDKDNNSTTTVQVIGDPYIYGPNYIIEPAFYYNPPILDFFWGMNYHRWYSPYYWGYYPTYFHYRQPYEINTYLSNVYRHVNHDHRYYYSNTIRNEAYGNIRTTISRNDYATRYPDQSFTSRNSEIRNKRDFEFNRNGSVRNGVNRPSTNTFENRESQPRTTYQGQTRNNWNQRNQENNYTNQQNNGLKRDNNNTYQTRPGTSDVNRTNPPNSNGRVNQPRPRTETQTPTNIIRPENTNRNSTPATQPRINESRNSNSTEVKREPRTETRDNTNRNNERK